ncbi:spermatogenesis-associated protein 4-like isoform X2 [Dysidea avara]|uniref:spermatogenesis-associated protein 4-like isoform X2 n=1 Tax=Dysidea avara TaxID=196820 RepID=UPI00332F94F2
MAGLPREVIKWLQSLDLSHSVKNVRRDFANGCLVAEIFSWYYPQDIQLHTISNGASVQSKLANWQQIDKVITKHNLNIGKDVTDGVIHNKPGAAITLVEQLYIVLTNRVIRAKPTELATQEFNDSTYQSQLPPYARSTASQCIKNNMAVTEYVTEPDRNHCADKIHAIMEVHNQQRKQEREKNPERFGIKTPGTKTAMKQREITMDDSTGMKPASYVFGIIVYCRNWGI